MGEQHPAAKRKNKKPPQNGVVLEKSRLKAKASSLSTRYSPLLPVFVRGVGNNIIPKENVYVKCERDERHVNEKVVPNPNRRDKEPMYIGKRVRHDIKRNFESKPLRIDDKDVFPEGKDRFCLNSKDKHNALIHTGAIMNPKRKKR